MLCHCFLRMHEAMHPANAAVDARMLNFCTLPNTSKAQSIEQMLFHHCLCMPARLVKGEEARGRHPMADSKAKIDRFEASKLSAFCLAEWCHDIVKLLTAHFLQHA